MRVCELGGRLVRLGRGTGWNPQGKSCECCASEVQRKDSALSRSSHRGRYTPGATSTDKAGTLNAVTGKFLFHQLDTKVVDMAGSIWSTCQGEVSLTVQQPSYAPCPPPASIARAVENNQRSLPFRGCWAYSRFFARRRWSVLSGAVAIRCGVVITGLTGDGVTVACGRSGRAKKYPRLRSAAVQMKSSRYPNLAWGNMPEKLKAEKEGATANVVLLAASNVVNCSGD